MYKLGNGLYDKLQSYDLARKGHKVFQLGIIHPMRKTVKIGLIGRFDFNSRNFEEFDIVVTNSFGMNNEILKEYDKHHPYVKSVCLFELVPSLVGHKINLDEYPTYDYENMSWSLRIIGSDRWCWIPKVVVAKHELVKCLLRHGIQNVIPATSAELYNLDMILGYDLGINIITS